MQQIFTEHAPLQGNQQPTDTVHMVSPYFEGTKSISGLGLPQFLGFGPGSGAKPLRLNPNLEQNLARVHPRFPENWPHIPDRSRLAAE